MQYPSFQNSDFDEISQHCNRKIILTFFCRVILPLSRQAYLHTTEFVYRFQALKLNLVENFRFTNCYGKANKKRTAKHDWTPIVCYWANRKPFLSARGNIWNSKAVFYNKTTCLLRCGCFNRDYELLLLFSIMTPWWDVATTSFLQRRPTFPPQLYAT